MTCSRLITGNVRSKANPEGLLTQDAGEYLRCFQIQHEKLEELYREDEQVWISWIENLRAEQEEMK